MGKREELTDEQWAILEPLIRTPARRADGGGRRITHSDRAVLDGILWVLRTSAAWADLPARFPSGSTCFRGSRRWVRLGVLQAILAALARDLEDRGKINSLEPFIDGIFVVVKKGPSQWERPSGERIRRSWLLQTLRVFHLPCTRLLLLHMASPLSKLPSLKPSTWDDPNDLSGIVPTTAIRSISVSLAKALR